MLSLLTESETQLVEQFERFVDDFRRVPTALARVSRLPLGLPFALREAIRQRDAALFEQGQVVRRRQGGVLNEKPEFLFVRGGGSVHHGMIVAFPPCFPTRICDIEAAHADFGMFKGFLPD